MDTNFLFLKQLSSNPCFHFGPFYCSCNDVIFKGGLLIRLWYFGISQLWFQISNTILYYNMSTLVQIYYKSSWPFTIFDNRKGNLDGRGNSEHNLLYHKELGGVSQADVYVRRFWGRWLKLWVIFFHCI